MVSGTEKRMKRGLKNGENVGCGTDLLGILNTNSARKGYGLHRDFGGEKKLR